MINPAYPDSHLTGKIIGCAMEVHKIIGNGFQEVIYQKAYNMKTGLLINFGSTSLQFKRVMKPTKMKTIQNQPSA